MTVSSYKELIVWQKAMNLTEMVYGLVKKLPREELFGLSDQMRRAAVSIPSNIAEGQSRNTTKDFIWFLSIACGSRSELETQLLLCVRLKYLTQEEAVEAASLLEEIGRMLTTLMAKLRARGSW